MAENPLPLSEVLREEYLRLHGPLPDDIAEELDKTGDEKTRLEILYRAIHRLAGKGKPGRTAVCLSGGGIRSATFGLGMLQALAGFSLLSKFDYLSTVSGGGYIGGWLSSYIRRAPRGTIEVEESIRGTGTRNPIAPEVEPLTWLRRFSNYLTPKLGLLSGDTWAFVGSYLRNLLLGLLIYIPFLAAILALPRLAVGLLRSPLAAFAPDVLLMIAGVLMLFAVGTLGLSRPVLYQDRGWLTNGIFQRRVLVPLVAAAMLLVIYWAAVYGKGTTNARWLYAVIGFVAVNFLPTLVYMMRYVIERSQQRQRNVRRDSSEQRYGWKKFAFELLGSVVGGLVGAGLLYAVAQLFDDPIGRVMPAKLTDWHSIPPALSGAPSEMFLIFAVPLVLGIVFVEAAIFVGVSSWYNEEYDREWWGRAGGWVLLAALGWIVVTAITIYGPVGIFFAPKIYAAVGTGSGLLAVLLGKSGRTSAQQREKNENAGVADTGSNLTMALAAPLFVVAILALLSLITSEILYATRPACPSGNLSYEATRRCVQKLYTSQELELRLAGTYEIRESTPIPETDLKREFATSKWAAADRAAINSIAHLWIVDTTTFGEGLLLVIGLGAFAWIVSFFVGANQFSMHGLYRNRLIRAYLGASRTERDRRPNAFTGFDPTDSFPVDLLRPEAFWPSTFVNVVRDGTNIINDPTLTEIQQRTRDAIQEAVDHPTDAERAQRAAHFLASDLNRSIEAGAMVKPGPLPRTVLNRQELERRFPGAFHPMANHVHPMHLIGITLNLVAGDNLAWQERKAEPFSVTPLHAGSFRVGYRPAARYGGPTGLTLGTAVAISGAAANPNMGYSSSPALAFLLSLFNVRLGWWLGNPKKETYIDRNPKNTLQTVLDEMFGMTDDQHDYINLSDGGHFDNMGLYEMVLRRCHCIVISDGSGDPGFAFGDFGNAIRKIRIDLGINIRIDRMQLFPRSEKNPKEPPKYCATADILYSDVDGPDAPIGKLLYIKPAFYGKKEPKDVYNYATTYPSFPHQSTGDQWYSESQFESYRQLGFFAVSELAKGRSQYPNVCELIEQAKQYIEDDEKQKAAEGRETPPPDTP